MTPPPKGDERHIRRSRISPPPPPPRAPPTVSKQVQPALGRELEKGKKTSGTPGASRIQEGDARARIDDVRRAFPEINF